MSAIAYEIDPFVPYRRTGRAERKSLAIFAPGLARKP